MLGKKQEARSKQQQQNKKHFLCIFFIKNKNSKNAEKQGEPAAVEPPPFLRLEAF
jgi:hypothetical protein